jgi:hypothetical protein
VSINIYIVSEGQITHPIVIIGQAVTEINSHLLVTCELDNVHLGACLPVDGKKKKKRVTSSIFAEVCSL